MLHRPNLTPEERLKAMQKACDEIGRALGRRCYIREDVLEEMNREIQEAAKQEAPPG